MARHARVLSIDAVDAMSAALVRFAEEASVALTDLDLEIRRAVAWVQEDRKSHWKTQVRLGWDRVASARQELERRRLSGKVGGREPSCIEEKKALQLAKRRLEVAMEKVEAVRRWSHIAAKESDEYRGQIGQLAQWLVSDYPKLIAVLKRMAGSLEAYTMLKSSLPPLSTDGLPEAAKSAARVSPGPDETDEEDQEEPRDDQAAPDHETSVNSEDAR